MTNMFSYNMHINENGTYDDAYNPVHSDNTSKETSSRDCCILFDFEVSWMQRILTLSIVLRHCRSVCFRLKHERLKQKKIFYQ